MVWITGMSALCPLGQCPKEILAKMMMGRSAISRWPQIGYAPQYSRIGGDLSEFDVTQELRRTIPQLPDSMAARLKPMLLRLPRHVHFSLWLAVRAWIDRAVGLGKEDIPSERIAVIVGGNNLNNKYIYGETLSYQEAPDFIDGLYSASSLDSIHAAAVSEFLGATGPCYTIGAACASGIYALRSGIQELMSDDVSLVYVIGGIAELAPVELDNMVSMHAVAANGFLDDPSAASRPFDQQRYGFVPAQGGACMILSNSATREKPIGKLDAVAITSDAQHLPITSQIGQERTMAKVLDKAGVSIHDLAFISAHATSTPHGDVTEISAIRALCEASGVGSIPVNAPKSMLGHNLWSSALIETVILLQQLREGVMHKNLNLEVPDEEWMKEYCLDFPKHLDKKIAMKNAFGFGGYNASIVVSTEDF